jgi:hypothetical protein
VPSGWFRLRGSELALPAFGALVTVLAAYLTVKLGAHIGLAAIGIVLLYVLVVLAYLAVPHLAVAGTVALFAFVPALKVFITPTIGGIKDLVCLSAITAAAIMIIWGHRRPDRRVGALIALLMTLYVIDVGHGHGIAWAQGVRLTGEPLLLLIVGLVLPEPKRTLQYALGSLVVVGGLVALYGLAQQGLGQARLINLGYSYTAQVRTIDNHLRSFGTLDDPFAYAALLYFSIAAVAFWLRRGLLAWFLGGLMLLGLVASLVRTAVPVLIAFIALELIRRRRVAPAVCFLAATAVIAAGTLLGSSGTRTQAFTVYFSNGGSTVVNSPAPLANVALNGRVSAWQAAVGSNPFDWAFGRGVGQVGTAATRASQSLLPGSTPATSSSTNSSTSAVDSGYFATVADVGLIGLVLELALLWRLGMLAVAAARRNLSAGWIALAMLAALLLDASTRASFTGFPTAFVGMLIIGLALAAAAAPERDEDRGKPRAPKRNGDLRTLRTPAPSL